MSLHPPCAPSGPRDLSLSLTPELLIEAPVYDRLHALAMAAATSLPTIADDLLTELDRARLVAPGTLPGDVVTVGSRLSYLDLASGSIRSLQLVWPPMADLAALRLSVLTPLGVALIGLRVGQQITCRVRDGETRHLEVTRVCNDTI